MEVQKKNININSLDLVISQLIKKNEKTILFTVINTENQRRYLGVKIN